MVNKRLMRDIQEALDGALSPEQQRKLFGELDKNEDAALAYDKLEAAEAALQRAPHVRAPERLATNIMSRLAEQMQAQAEMQELSESSTQALMLTLSLVSLIMMPMMVSTSWLVLNAQADPELLSTIIQRLLALLSIFIRALAVLLETVEEIVRENPEAATFAMALIPLTLLGLLRYFYPEETPGE